MYSELYISLIIN